MYLNAILLKCCGVFFNSPLIISKCHVFTGEKAKLNCCDSVAKMVFGEKDFRVSEKTMLTTYSHANDFISNENDKRNCMRAVFDHTYDSGCISLIYYLNDSLISIVIIVNEAPLMTE